MHCCPYCKNNHIKKNGYMHRICDHKDIHRYMCLDCGRKFSDSTFSDFKGDHRPEVNFKIAKMASLGMKIVDIARKLNINRKTVSRKIQKYGPMYARKNLQQIKSFYQKPAKEVQVVTVSPLLTDKLKKIKITLAIDPVTNLILHGEIGKNTKAYEKRGLKNLLKTLRPCITDDVRFKSEMANSIEPFLKQIFKLNGGVQNLQVNVDQRYSRIKSRNPLYAAHKVLEIMRSQVSRFSDISWNVKGNLEMIQNHLNTFFYIYNRNLIAEIESS